MKPTIAIEEAVIKIYQKWLHSYLNADVTTYSFYLDDTYHFIGSTQNEEFLNKTATTKFFVDTADQLAGKCDLKNEVVTVEQFNELIFITHVFDAWFKIEKGWSFYGRFRFSSTLQQKTAGWRFIYQHFSTPDSKVDEGETIAFEKINSENLQLKQAIKRRTLELERKNRELEIEAALEKVRSRTMAMQNSSELPEAANNLFLQVQQLGIPAWSAGYCIWEDDQKSATAFMSSEGVIQKPFILPSSGVGYDFYKPLKNGQDFHVDELGGTLIKKHYEFMRTLPIFGEVIDGIMEAGLPIPTFQIFHIVYFDYGFVMFITYEPVQEAHNIFKRFAKVFEQTYTRFLDLQKAEAQARESEIELALERVRARTMAMQHSDELQEASFLLDEQVRNLGIKTWGCAFNIYGEKESTEWFGNEAGVLSKYTVPRAGIFKEYYQKGKKGKSIIIKEFSGKACVDHYEYMSALPVIGDVLKELKKTNNGYPTYQLDHVVYFKYGYLLFITKEHVPEAHDIFKRFAKVFEQTYTRFLDLEKAEAQAREAEIELALERVRARTMAMQHSDELAEASSLLFQQMKVLEINNYSSGFTIWDENKRDLISWMCNADGSLNPPFRFPIKENKWHQEQFKYWKNGGDFILKDLSKKELQSYFKYLRSFPLMDKAFKKSIAAGHPMPKRQVHHVANFSHGNLLFITLEPKPEAHDIFKRFAKVFDQTYTRFLDLKKAEEQAREAQIEAALEKVRSRSLAMHKPDELQEVVTVVAEKLNELGVILDAGGAIICTYFPDNKDVMHWISAPDFSYSGSYFVPYFEDKTFNDAWTSKNRGDSYFSQAYPQEDKNKFFEYAFEHSDYRRFPDDFKQFILQSTEYAFSFAWQKNSAILIPSHSGIVPSESDAEILKRFAKVFEQAYIRFMDLQKAEESARKSQIDSALERVRARAMAMHQSNELSEAAELLYQEFYKLGVTPFSCGYLINDDENNYWKVWMTDANDESFKDFWTLPFDADHHLRGRYESWKKKESFHVTLLEGEENVEHHKIIAQFAPWKADSMGDLPDRLVLNSAHFTHGHLLIVAGELLTPEVASILTRFATVFDQTYTRFLDLKKAEHQALLIKEEKERLEVTINDLRATQKQLIQSEKMASLGELTAGIAHEIQNPLNFVNNFSEVSKELLDEMLEELANGDMEEVKAIMNNVVQNLEKINHHGKRADGIVKGMLQHSRSSSGTKEPTDINALADEYLRLAYHGLRAKDKSFNAELVTDFDASVGLVNVVPQDMGRVILNLITNAFYDVNERKQATNEDAFKPTVSVSTKKINDTIQISIKDNGNGIPKKIIDKIFQPFFTTKPTGQGTGLGLSMSYDIVTKGHGGSLTVISSEGEGSEFLFTLPALV